MHSSDYRQRAAEAARLSRRMSDPKLAAILRDIATGYGELADQLEAQEEAAGTAVQLRLPVG